MKVFKLATGLAVGYVLGARAGREKYEQIVAVARKAQGRPPVTQPVVTRTEEPAGQDDSTPAVETTATPLALAGTTPADSAPRPARRRRKSTVPTPGPAADPLT